MISIIKKGYNMNVREIGSHKTMISRVDDSIVVRYHNTDVISLTGNIVTLNNGGYETVTTKRRMNQASIQWNLGIVVYQVDYCWYVKTSRDIYPYSNGMKIDCKSGKLVI